MRDIPQVRSRNNPTTTRPRHPPRTSPVTPNWPPRYNRIDSPLLGVIDIHHLSTCASSADHLSLPHLLAPSITSIHPTSTFYPACQGQATTTRPNHGLQILHPQRPRRRIRTASIRRDSPQLPSPGPNPNSSPPKPEPALNLAILLLPNSLPATIHNDTNKIHVDAEIPPLARQRGADPRAPHHADPAVPV
jgi:hypothetical protein